VSVIIVNSVGEVNNDIDMDDSESASDGGAEDCGTSSIEFGDGGDMGYLVEAVLMS